MCMCTYMGRPEVNVGHQLLLYLSFGDSLLLKHTLIWLDWLGEGPRDPPVCFSSSDSRHTLQRLVFIRMLEIRIQVLMSSHKYHLLRIGPMRLAVRIPGHRPSAHM